MLSALVLYMALNRTVEILVREDPGNSSLIIGRESVELKTELKSKCSLMFALIFKRQDNYFQRESYFEF